MLSNRNSLDFSCGWSTGLENFTRASGSQSYDLQTLDKTDENLHNGGSPEPTFVRYSGTWETEPGMVYTVSSRTARAM